MKSFVFIDLTLILMLFVLTCSSAPLSQSSAIGMFAGTSPCDAVSRRPLGIPATASCEMIRWNLTLYQEANTLAPSTYVLDFTYGMGQPNTSGFANGGTIVERKGRWTTTRGSRTDGEAVVYELQGERSAGPIYLLKLDHNLLHLLDSDRTLAVGSGGWSYTLSRTQVGGQPHPANATGSEPAKASPTNSSKSGAVASSVVGRFVGRSPCTEIARQINKAVEPDCMKVKWDLTLYQDSKTLAPTTYKLRGTFYRDQTKEGAWTISRGAKVDPEAVVYQLDADSSQSSLLFLKADDNILLFLDSSRNLMVGNSLFSYTLNREK